MTEIQWLCDILLNFKLQKPVKDRFIARIGEVEASLTTRPTPVVRPLVSSIAQAPSTQRLLDEMEAEISPIAPHVAPRITVPQEVVTSKGNGTSTRGPRKF